MSDMQEIIEKAFENRAEIIPASVDTHVKDAVCEAIQMLDSGRLRVAEKVDVTGLSINGLKRLFCFLLELKTTN